MDFNFFPSPLLNSWDSDVTRHLGLWLKGLTFSLLSLFHTFSFFLLILSERKGIVSKASWRSLTCCWPPPPDSENWSFRERNTSASKPWSFSTPVRHYSDCVCVCVRYCARLKCSFILFFSLYLIVGHVNYNMQTIFAWLFSGLLPVQVPLLF